DADGRMLMLDHSQAGTWVKRSGTDKFERIPFGEPQPVRPGDEVRLGSETGPKLDLATAKRPEGSLSRAGSDATGANQQPGSLAGERPAASTTGGAQEGAGNAGVNADRGDARPGSTGEGPQGSRGAGYGAVSSRPVGEGQGQRFHAGEDVHFDGQDHKLLAFDQTTGEAIIKDESRSDYAGMFRKVAKDELARDFRPVQV